MRVDWRFLAVLLSAGVLLGPGTFADSRREVLRIDLVHFVGNGKSSQTKHRDCYDFIGSHVASPIECVINPSNSGMREEFLLDAILRAAATWDRASSAKVFSDFFTVDYAAQAPAVDGTNVITFANFSQNDVLAFVSVILDAHTYEFMEADTVINAAYPWGDATQEAGVFDLRSILTHEFGHWVGLADIYDPGCSAVTMYGYSSPGEIIKRTLSNPDKRGLRAVFHAGE